MSKNILRFPLEINDLFTLVQKAYNEINKATKEQLELNESNVADKMGCRA
jgi:outer membrane lipopolysaccharide assembly protein LptE/RlpB